MSSINNSERNNSSAVRYPILEAVFADIGSNNSADEYVINNANNNGSTNIYNNQADSNGDNANNTSASLAPDQCPNASDVVINKSPPKKMIQNDDRRPDSSNETYQNEGRGKASNAPMALIGQNSSRSHHDFAGAVAAFSGAMFPGQNLGVAFNISNTSSNTQSPQMDDFEQRKRHRSAGPDVTTNDLSKPSYTDLLAFARERRPSGGYVSVVSHYPSQQSGMSSASSSRTLSGNELPPVPPFGNVTRNVNAFDAVSSLSHQNNNNNRQSSQGNFPGSQFFNTASGGGRQFSGGSSNRLRHVSGEKRSREEIDNDSSSDESMTYENIGNNNNQNNNGNGGGNEVGGIMHTLSYQRAFCPLPPGRGQQREGSSEFGMQLPVPAHHTMGQLPQRHFSGPAGISMAEGSQQANLMMMEQGLPVSYYSHPSTTAAAAAAFLGSQLYGQQQSQQLVQGNNANISNSAGISGNSNSTNPLNNFLSAQAHHTHSSLNSHNRHPSEPTPRTRRPSTGKSIVHASRPLDHNVASSSAQLSVMVRDEQRKRQHNDIEKRRRSNINERIQQLATLLPNCSDPEFKQHKGNILTKVVDYIKSLQGLPEQVQALQLENSKLINQNMQLQQRVSALTEMIRSNGFQIPNQFRLNEQSSLIDLATTGMANTAICNNQSSPTNSMSSSSQSLTPPGSRHPSGNSGQQQCGVGSPGSGVNNRQMVQPYTGVGGDLLQMFQQQQQPQLR